MLVYWLIVPKVSFLTKPFKRGSTAEGNRFTPKARQYYSEKIDETLLRT